MGHNLQSTSEAIAEIYAAAGEADALQRMVAVLGTALDVDSGGLWLADHGQIVDLTLSEAVAASMPDYLAHFHAIDLWGGATPKVRNRATLGSELVSDGELLRSEFYNDFARHYGMREPLGLALDLYPGVSVMIALNRTSGSRLQAEDKVLLDTLGFHVGAALRLHHKFMAPRPCMSLDAMAFGVVICSGAAIVRYANSAAEAIARTGAVSLGSRATGLSTIGAGQTERLRRLVHDAAQGSSGAITLKSRTRPDLYILATPLPASDRRRLSRDAMLCLRSGDAAPPILATTMQQMFSLSAAQAALLVDLSQGKTLIEAANERGVATATARTHLRAILLKTGMDDLRDLLRMMSTLPPINLS